MREDDSNWFSKWEDELPAPEELMPISQTLITPDLASAFDIRNPTPVALFHHPNQQGHINSYGVQLLQQHQQQQQQSSSTPHPQHNSSEFDSSSAELCGGGGVGAVSGSELDQQARTLKRPRLVWTPQLHKRFVDAVAHLGIKNAVPKTIMQLMSVDGLTRENVASHLQKYRLYLKRMQGPNGGNGSGSSDTDRLFASSPVPAHFLHQVNGPPHAAAGGNGLNSDRFVSYMPVAVVGHQQAHGQYGQYHREAGQFGLAQNGGGQFDQAFLARQAQLLGPNRNGMLLQNGNGFVEDLEVSASNNSRKVLSLFPSIDD